jgi:hypothetical protein
MTIANGKETRDRIKVTPSIMTWNVRELYTKENEIINVMKKKKINIVISTKTKKKLNSTKDMDDFAMLWSGVPQSKRASSGVAIIVDKKWKNYIKNYTFVNDTIVIVKLRMPQGNMTVVGTYTPEEGRIEETEKYYHKLQATYNGINKTDFIIITGDMNARVGKTPVPNILGCYGEPILNNNGRKLIEFTTYN